MFHLARFSVTQPVLVNLFTVLVVIAGTVSFLYLPREMFPPVQADFVFVSTLYPRASADEIEKTITVLIEDEISDVLGIKSLRSTSVEGRSQIVIEVNTDVEDTEEVRRKIETEVDKVVEELPTEAEKPLVTRFIFEFVIVTISVAGPIEEHELKQTAEGIKDQLETLPGVSDVDIVGERDEEIWVEVDPLRLYGYELTLEDIRQSIAAGGLDLAAGLARTSGQEFIVRTKELYSGPEDLRRVVLRSDRGKGGRIRIGDIANIRDTFEEATDIARLDGQRCINLEVKQRPGGDTLKIADGVNEKLSELLTTLPDGVTVKPNRDFSFAVRERLNLLTRNGTYGLILCLLLLRVFLSGRMALITGLGIPFAFMGGLLLMTFAGVSLNLISMFALIMVLGMLVDDGIVVAENTHRYMEQGIDPVTAAIRGSGEVFMSVVAAIATTVCAFAPILLMTGIMGKFCRHIPMVVCFCLLASLIEALMVLPSHLAEWSRAPDYRKVKWHKSLLARFAIVPTLFVLVMRAAQFVGRTFDASPLSPTRWFKPFQRTYSRFLIRCLRHRLVFMLIAVLVIGGVFTYARFNMKFQLFRNVDFAFFAINIETPEGTRLEQTERALSIAEDYLLGKPKQHIEAVISRVGMIEDLQNGQPKFGSNRAQILVDLTESSKRPGTNAQEILNEARRNFPDLPGVSSAEFQVDEGGPPIGAAVSFRIMGKVYSELLAVSEEVQEFLATKTGVLDIKDDFNWGKEEFRIDVDEAKAADLGLDVASVAREVRNAFAGGIATTFTRGKEDVEIHVKFTEEYRRSLSNIRLMKFRNKEGNLIPFDSFAKVEHGQGYSVIQRWNQKRAVTVTADVDDDIITSTEINNVLMNRYGSSSKEYPGVSFGYGGEAEDTKESMSSLFRSFLFAIFINYGIIATIFNSFAQPLVVMSAVPLGLVGVVIGLMINGEPMGFMALLGTVALVGIVVNDSIILLDFVNRARLRGMSRWRSLVWASRTRVRAILLTTVTTIGGLTPMLFGLTGTSSFLVPMAIALVYGLLFATVLLLLVVPVFMSFLDDAKLFFGFRLVREKYDESLLERSYNPHRAKDSLQ